MEEDENTKYENDGSVWICNRLWHAVHLYKYRYHHWKAERNFRTPQCHDSHNSRAIRDIFDNSFGSELDKHRIVVTTQQEAS